MRTLLDRCCSATLAAAHTLWADGHAAVGVPIVLTSKSGELVCTQEHGDLIQLDFPKEASRCDVLPPCVAVEGARSAAERETVDIICAALGLPEDRIVHVCRNRMDVLVEVSAEDFAVLKPDIVRLAQVKNCRVLSVTAPAVMGTSYDFQSRFFAPAVGVPEVRASLKIICSPQVCGMHACAPHCLNPDETDAFVPRMLQRHKQSCVV